MMSSTNVTVRKNLLVAEPARRWLGLAISDHYVSKIGGGLRRFDSMTALQGFSNEIISTACGKTRFQMSVSFFFCKSAKIECCV